ncbi:MAG TPA: phosphoribosyltransferase [Burkholderiales bacterium]|jgi:putative phosphoribosyl transferase|nr:phosphoribosyltransferase [Burkholderiales bacterium]
MMKRNLLPFPDRDAAGRALAKALEAYRERDDVLVLALPRGGVPVAAEIAAALGAELDLMIVRKLGAPGQPELAMGAIASGGVRVLNRDVIASLGISDHAIEEVARREQQELERREQVYRGSRPRPTIEARCVILVDDGVATGATIRAGIEALRRQKPGKLVVAVPVAPPDTVARLRSVADEVVCLATPEQFWAIGQWYIEFPQLSDDAVREALADSWNATSALSGRQGT